VKGFVDLSEINKIMTKNNKKINWPLFGNKNVIDFLSKSILNDSVSGAYLFLGSEDLGKTTVAEYFAKSLLCEGIDELLPCEKCFSCRQFNKKNHTDFVFIEKKQAGEDNKKAIKNISIEQVRDFSRALSMSSFSGSYKIGLIKDSDYLSENAANSLLKILEEPKEKALIILTAKNIENLPATISSRCQILNFYPANFDLLYNYLIKEFKISRIKAKNIARLSLGRPAKARKYLEEIDYYNNYIYEVKIFIDFLKQSFNERFSKIEELVGIKTDVEKNKKINNIIESWQGIVRDLILLSLGQPNIIRNESLRQELEAAIKEIKVEDLIKINKLLENSKQSLKANVGVKTVLDNIAVNV
jgi:DNA polymerase III subunit delta'